MEWYFARYGDDPSTDNIFGREDLRERRTPLLHHFLRRGGALRDFAQLAALTDAARRHP
jgi:hypothetical protein